MTLETIARKLKTTPQSLLKEGIFAYLQGRLSSVSIEMDGLKHRWQIESAEDFEKAIKSGKIHEFSKGHDAGEDFFRFSHLEEEKRHLLKFIREYAF